MTLKTSVNEDKYPIQERTLEIKPAEVIQTHLPRLTAAIQINLQKYVEDFFSKKLITEAILKKVMAADSTNGASILLIGVYDIIRISTNQLSLIEKLIIILQRWDETREVGSDMRVWLHHNGIEFAITTPVPGSDFPPQKEQWEMSPHYEEQFDSDRASFHASTSSKPLHGTVYNSEQLNRRRGTEPTVHYQYQNRAELPPLSEYNTYHSNFYQPKKVLHKQETNHIENQLTKLITLLTDQKDQNELMHQKEKQLIENDIKLKLAYEEIEKLNARITELKDEISELKDQLKAKDTRLDKKEDQLTQLYTKLLLKEK